jgi:hypothetical protein
MSVQRPLGPGATDLLTVTAGHVTIANGTITGAGNTGTSHGITVGSGTDLIGFGTLNINAAGTISGAGAVGASNGTLELNGTVTNLGTLQVGGGSTDKLLLDGISSATTATFLGSTGTLELNTSGSLTLTKILSVGANTVKLDGAGTTQITDTRGVTLAGGEISGTGAISSDTNIIGLGTVSLSSFDAADTVTSLLEFDGAVGTNNAQAQNDCSTPVADSSANTRTTPAASTAEFLIWKTIGAVGKTVDGILARSEGRTS